MTTLDVMRWNFSALDMWQLAGIALAGAALLLLDQAHAQLGRWLDLAATAIG